MRKTEKKIEIIKTLVITLLFLVVMLMVLLHFNALRKRNENGADNYPDNIFTLKSPLSTEIDTFSENMLIPAEIAFKKENGSVFAICSGKNYMQEIYSLIEGDIATMLSHNCIVIEDDSLAFDEAIESSGFIYIRYHTPLPAALMYLHSIEDSNSNSAAINDKIATSVISEIIIFPENTKKDSIFALSREMNGIVKKYILDKSLIDKRIGIPDLEIYIDAGAMVSAKFYASAEKNLLSSTLIFDDMSPKSSISCSSGIEGLSTNTDLQSSFAKKLDINPNKTGSYFDEEQGGTVYMSTHGTLTFTDEYIEYSTLNNTDGISLSVFSGKGADEAHSMYECLSVANSIAAIFSKIEGANIGDGELLLTDLYRKGETLTLKFGYFYDNIPIETKNHALILEINSKKLTGMKLFPAKINADRSNIQKSVPASWIVNIAEGTSNKNEKYTLTYRYEKNADGKFYAEWTPVKIKS